MSAHQTALDMPVGIHKYDTPNAQHIAKGTHAQYLYRQSPTPPFWYGIVVFVLQISIRVTSEKYRPVANRSSLLFFLMNDLVKVHSYYIYSLAAFTKVCLVHEVL